jgi:hypothetical protein
LQTQMGCPIGRGMEVGRDEEYDAGNSPVNRSLGQY